MYEGTNTLDLSINYKEDTLKNIVLIGGLNGNGKTSIIEAVQLCLYGKKAKHLVRPSEYENFVTSRFSRNALKRGETKMKVIVEFEDVYLQELSNTLSVERTWTISTYSGSLKILDDNEFIVRKNRENDNNFTSELQGEEAEEFIYGLIPPEISQFFFFDGEKIQEMAEDKNYGERISKALRDVLGISILEVLQNDLAEVRNRYAKSSKATQIKKDITEKESTIAELEDLIENNKLQMFELEDQIQTLRNEIQYVEDDLRRITNVAIQDREDLKMREAELIQHQREIEEKLREILEFELPLAICAKLCGDLEDRLELEQAFKVQDKARQAMKPQLEKLLSEVFDNGEEPKPKLHFSQIEFYKGKISRIWYELFNAEDDNNLSDDIDIDEIWHDINDKKYQFIIQQIEHISQNLIPDFDDLIRERQRKMSELRNIQRNLKDEGDSEVLNKVEQMKELSGELRKKETICDQLQDEIERHDRKIKVLDTQKRKLEEQFFEAEKMQKKVVFIQSVKKTLLDYEMKLKEKKISLLENSIRDMFLRLCNKEDMVSEISIDIQTFIVSIKDAQGRVIEKHNLSSGLKQVFAFSLLWGLTQVSKIEIPIIIDTPFGRLDSVHRTNILQNYYPNAGRQVIVLSTDTEIDQQNAQLLEHHIEKRYLLQRKSELEAIQITSNYF